MTSPMHARFGADNAFRSNVATSTAPAQACRDGQNMPALPGAPRTALRPALTPPMAQLLRSLGATTRPPATSTLRVLRITTCVLVYLNRPQGPLCRREHHGLYPHFRKPAWLGACADAPPPLEWQMKNQTGHGRTACGRPYHRELLKVAPELYDITVFGAEPHPNYKRILLSPCWPASQTLDEIVLTAGTGTKRQPNHAARRKKVSRWTASNASCRRRRHRRRLRALLMCTGSNPSSCPCRARTEGVIASATSRRHQRMIAASESKKSRVMAGPARPGSATA